MGDKNTNQYQENTDKIDQFFYKFIVFSFRGSGGAKKTLLILKFAKFGLGGNIA